MATFVVTLSNYNNAAFWSSISESGGGHTLDFSALPSGFHVSFDPDARIVWVWDGSDWISISEQGYGGSFQLGAPTQFSAFDTIITGDANTSMEGDAGAETFETGDGTDSINAGGGSDTVAAGGGNDTVDGGTGNDSISGGGGDDHLLGGSGADTISGNTGNDSILGGADNDALQGGEGQDTIIGGTGNDAIIGDGLWLQVAEHASAGGAVTDLTVTNSADGAIKIWWINGNGVLVDYGTIAVGQTVSLSTYVDDNWILRDLDGRFLRLIEGAANQIVDFGATGLNDYIDGGSGNDLIYGQYGDDTIFYGTGLDTVYGGDGNDLIDDATGYNATSNPALLYGDAGDDTIYGTAGNDTIYGGNDNDLIGGEGGNDSLFGDAGNDTLHGHEGNDSLSGGSGNDSLDGGSGNDTILGGTGNDTISGSSAGNGGSVSWTDVGNNANVVGTTGTNYFRFDATTDSSVTITLDDGGGTVNDGDGQPDYVLINSTNNVDKVFLRGFDHGVDRIVLLEMPTGQSATGTTGKVTVTLTYANGNAQTFTIEHNGGAGYSFNSFFTTQIPGGTADDDHLDGGDDADTFLVEDDFGNDTIIGGEGGTDDDTIDLSALTGAVTVTYTGNEAGTITDGTDTITFSEVERLILTEQADVVDMGSGISPVTIDAGGGDDAITRIRSGQSVEGGDGNDTLMGEAFDGAGVSTLSGGAGDDFIDGGDRSDLIYGGDGDDRIEAGEENASGDDDTIYGGAGNDTITSVETDLQSNDNIYGEAGADYINVTGGDANLLDGGADNDTIISGTGNDTLVGGAGDDRLEGGAGDDSLEGGAGNDTFLGDSITEVALSIGGTSRNGINPQFEVYADGVLIHTGEVTWAQDGTSSFNPNAAGAFQTVNVALPDGLPASVEVRFINDFGPGDNGTPGDRNLHLDSITVGDTTYEAETDATISDGFAGAQAVNLFGMGSSATFDTSGAAPISGNDHMEGGDGADTFILDDNFGNDTIIGGEGGTDDDTIDLSAMNGPVTVTYTGNEAGTITDGTDTITFSEIERIVLTDQADSVDASDVFEGVFGDNPGIDVDAGGGNDTINGSWGGDTIDGGAGDDVIDADYGDDSVTGGSGQDTLLGGFGNDTLEGGDGDDSIDGGLEGDTLAGGAGDDLITGGDGNDTFVYTPGDGADTITDFNFGNSGALRDDDSNNNDVIDLSAFYDSVDELRDDFNDDGVLNHSNSGSVDYSNNSTLDENNNLTFNGADQSSFTADNTGVVCFTSGTAIRTPRGDVLIDDLRVGDLVSTLDNGSQPIRWIGQRHVGPEDLRTQTKLRPVLIPKGVLGASRPLLVSRQHAVLVGRDRLARAAHLTDINGQRVRLANGKRHVTYIHLMFDAHQIIFAEDVAAESFYPGRLSLEMLDDANWDRFVENNPAFARSMSADTVIQAYGETARVVAKRSEVADLLLAPERLPSRMLA